jgi:tetratricopeptide (TPR) repeat protein
MQSSAIRWMLYVWMTALALVTARAVPCWASNEKLWAYAIRQEPTNAFAHLCYAAALSDPQQAANQYRQALLFNPNSDTRFAATNNLASLYLERGFPKSALIWAQEAVRQRPRQPQALYNLCRAYLQTGDLEKAREVFGEIRSHAPAASPLLAVLRRELEHPPHPVERSSVAPQHVN